MDIPENLLVGAARILDVGGWFSPESKATHVIDLMPWETRRVKLSLAPVPGERFTTDTWYQADFLAADFRLPFEDMAFDLVLCGQTVEDLADPRRLLDEMARVGRRGIIESPSRIIEQTVGIRDRQSTRPGHPHHHWILESDGRELFLFSKEDSQLNEAATLLPLLTTEKRLQAGGRLDACTHVWENGALKYHLVRGAECARRAREFVGSSEIPGSDRMNDRFLRLARRLRSYAKGRFTEDFSWWKRIVEASRPYSRIDLGAQ